MIAQVVMQDDFFPHLVRKLSNACGALNQPILLKHHFTVITTRSITSFDVNYDSTLLFLRYSNGMCIAEIGVILARYVKVFPLVRYDGVLNHSAWQYGFWGQLISAPVHEA